MKNTQVKVQCTQEDVMDGTYGGCIACGELQPGCEPDARNYTCDSCDEPQVFGLEELAIMDMIELTDVSDD